VVLPDDDLRQPDAIGLCSLSHELVIWRDVAENGIDRRQRLAGLRIGGDERLRRILRLWVRHDLQRLIAAAFPVGVELEEARASRQRVAEPPPVLLDFVDP
jgi:hypothetical protein